jgi:hypothetical protein
MIVYNYRTGMGELIPCIITDSTKAVKTVKLLCNSKTRTYKAFDTVHTLPEYLTRATVNLEVTNTLQTSYIVKGEIYELIGVHYSPASYMSGEAFTYKIRIHDGRIGSYRPDCFKMLMD